ncbi:MAG: glycine--tRNA ligase subunit beta, partial [Gemmatimonadaceae bacterium]|nr:glycine--tRNA ligase subunit beta [Caulobacter sp.]
GADPDKAAEAARLAKADLTSQMVGEFPELQGVMGGYYARAAGLDPEIADAIRDHYKPQGPADAVPTAPLSVAVALADKLDTLVGFFAIDEKPTGSKDPYGLRRVVLGIFRIIEASNVPIELRGNNLLFDQIRRIKGFESKEYLELAPVLDAITFDFFGDRMEVLLKDRGIGIDVVRAALSQTQSGFKPIDLVARVEALDGFLKTDDGRNLLAGYKRASNILKAEEKKGWKAQGDRVLLDDASAPEVQLHDALRLVEPALASALAREDFTAAMQELAGLRGPVDAFLDGVFVNSEVAAERDNRLKTLAAVRDAMGQVADFSLIAG